MLCDQCEERCTTTSRSAIPCQSWATGLILHCIRSPHGGKRDQSMKGSCMFKGAVHIHSTYSDGEFTLAELRQVFRTAGCDFVCTTDHAEDFDENKLRAYADECTSLSDDHFRLVAGLEYE